MATATNNFDDSAEIGQGGYGKVYKGKLADGTAVAIKRAHEDSLQGSKEFVTEIELLSRVDFLRFRSLLLGVSSADWTQILLFFQLLSACLVSWSSCRLLFCFW